MVFRMHPWNIKSVSGINQWETEKGLLRKIIWVWSLELNVLSLLKDLADSGEIELWPCPRSWSVMLPHVDFVHGQSPWIKSVDNICRFLQSPDLDAVIKWGHVSSGLGGGGGRGGGLQELCMLHFKDGWWLKIAAWCWLRPSDHLGTGLWIDSWLVNWAEPLLFKLIHPTHQFQW